IVDDDARNIFALGKLLASQGVLIESATNGMMGVDKLRNMGPFDAVLMDISMPVMDGLEALAEIRADERFAELPVIAVTAKAMAEDRRACMDAGASEYMSKPIEPTALLAMLQRWVQPERRSA
ncbi:MAG: response regulator, partial [Deltaproteobacteria bacterium]|nr:response regulator [Deltaproteobacteria bacterium]